MFFTTSSLIKPLRHCPLSRTLPASRIPKPLFCRSANTNKDVLQIFQTNTYHLVTLEDVQDALIATTSLDHYNKTEYFNCVGINYENVEKYYVEVCKLERLIMKETNFWSFFKELIGAR